MNTRLQTYATAATEAALLVTLLGMPTLLHYYGFRVFELPKSALSVAMGLLAAVLLLIAAAESGSGVPRGLWRHPLVLAALLSGLATGLATLLGDQPRQSFWGTLERGGGFIQALSALAFFTGAAWLGRDPRRRERILASLVAGSAAPAVYALTQALQLQVVPGRVENVDRAFGTLANPIFLAAYLMLILPLTVQRILRAARRASFAAFAGWSLLLLLQLAALASSDSRGPVLGLAAGGLMVLLALSLRPGRAWLGYSSLGLLVAGLVFIVLFNQPGSPLEPLRDLPVIGRFGEISVLTGDSSGARLRIWRSSNRLLREEPGRLIVGHGPEQFKTALLPHGEIYLAGFGQRDRLVDRAHNVLLDKLVTEGLPGGLALLLTFGAALWTAAVAAGLARTRGQRRALALCLAGASAMGALAFFVQRPLPLLGAAPAIFAGALSLFGLVAGLGLFLLGRLVLGARGRGRDGHHAADGEVDAAAGGGMAQPEPTGSADLEGAAGTTAAAGLDLAFLAVFTAATVEAAFGIQVVTLQMLIWLLAGLLLARRLGPLPTAVETASRAARRRRRGGADAEAESEASLTIGWTPGSAGYGLVVAAWLSAIVYALWIYGAPVLAHTRLVLLLMLLAAAAAALLAAADAGEGVLTTFIVALLGLGLYLALRQTVLALSDDASMLWTASLLWWMGLALVAGFSLRRPLAEGAPGWRGAVGMVYPLLLVPAVAILLLASIRPVRGDVYFQSANATFEAALASDDSQLLLDAEALYQLAVEQSPDEATYPLLMAQHFTRLGSLSGADIEAAALAFDRAQGYIERAELLEPDMPYHKVNRGHLQLVFAQMLSAQQPEQARAIAANAALPLQDAFDIVPYDPAIVADLATARWLEGRTEEALALLEYSRDQLDAGSALTLRLLGQIYYDLERLDEAEAAFESALGTRLNQQERLGILVALGEIARERGQLDRAIARYEEVLRAGGGDWSLLFNLGLLYRDSGQVEAARAAWTQALQAAPPEAQEQVQGALQSLDAQP